VGARRRQKAKTNSFLLLICIGIQISVVKSFNELLLNIYELTSRGEEKANGREIVVKSYSFWVLRLRRRSLNFMKVVFGNQKEPTEFVFRGEWNG
jgi:hypothetical protein